jgi:hypothetical protein
MVWGWGFGSFVEGALSYPQMQFRGEVLGFRVYVSEFRVQECGLRGKGLGLSKRERVSY